MSEERADDGGIEEDPGTKGGGRIRRSVSGAAVSAANARDRIRAALVMSRPVRPIPWMMA